MGSRGSHDQALSQHAQHRAQQRGITTSMIETIFDNADILVDTSQRVPVPPGIFVIWDGMGIVAKRIDHVPHSEPPKIVIKSINPEYQTYERDGEEVNIVGRVIWAARRL
jgi:phage repressor protein C with HTH and peptisase S24 domain